jgi:hypothetical protein
VDEDVFCDISCRLARLGPLNLPSSYRVTNEWWKAGGTTTYDGEGPRGMGVGYLGRGEVRAGCNKGGNSIVEDGGG